MFKSSMRRLRRNLRYVFSNTADFFMLYLFVTIFLTVIAALASGSMVALFAVPTVMVIVLVPVLFALKD